MQATHTESRITGGDPYVVPDARDQELLDERVTRLDAIDGPRVGDWVIWREDQGERVYRRISHHWGDSIQTSYGGSFHLGGGHVSFSGGLEPAVLVADLIDTHETREGEVWFFHHGHRRAHNAVHALVPFRVFAYVGEDRLHATLAHWAETDMAPIGHEHLIHFVDESGYEVGNYPLDMYGEPVTVGRALRDWERLTGIMAIKASDVVTIGGNCATHYGVRVRVVPDESSDATYGLTSSSAGQDEPLVCGEAPA